MSGDGGTSMFAETLDHAFTMVFFKFLLMAFFFFLLPCIKWPGPIPCVKLEQETVYFIKVITYGSWLESTVQ